MSSAWPGGQIREMTSNREPGPPALVLVGPIARSDIPAFCARAGAAFAGRDGDPVVFDVGALAPDAVTVDALARLQLTAVAIGRRVRFRHACVDLQELLALMGLSQVLLCIEGSGAQAWGQAEDREQARGVQEEADPGDPAI